MTNIAEARRVLEQARALGAADFCVCAGSRNAPLLAVLGASDLRIYSFVDERSAAFFALGRAKLTGRPVAVVTTSGTAVAELLPAAVEAHYSGTKLILITADRPARYRGTGAPQAIEQEEIFGVYGRGAVVHVSSQSSAAPAIIAQNADVAAIGGFSGRETNVSVSWLALQVRSGKVRWVLAERGGALGRGPGVPGDTRAGSKAAMAAVAQACRAVGLPASTAAAASGSATGTGAGTTTIAPDGATATGTLYDCQGRASQLSAIAHG